MQVLVASNDQTSLLSGTYRGIFLDADGSVGATGSSIVVAATMHTTMPHTQGFVQGSTKGKCQQDWNHEPFVKPGCNKDGILGLNHVDVYKGIIANQSGHQNEQPSVLEMASIARRVVVIVLTW
eukprot:scaffold2726_cov167-Amphora_coffeaeformis.AAC.14